MLERAVDLFWKLFDIEPRWWVLGVCAYLVITGALDPYCCQPSSFNDYPVVTRW